jgi:hypothetical protein
MNLERTEDSASRFARFVEELTSVINRRSARSGTVEAHADCA